MPDTVGRKVGLHIKSWYRSGQARVTSFHYVNCRAWAAFLPKHWVAFCAGESLVKMHGLASPGLCISDKYAEAIHCMTEDKGPKHFLFTQVFEKLTKWRLFTCPPAISSPLPLPLLATSGQVHWGSQDSAQLITKAESGLLGHKRETATEDSNYGPWTLEELSRHGSLL